MIDIIKYPHAEDFVSRKDSEEAQRVTAILLENAVGGDVSLVVLDTEGRAKETVHYDSPEEFYDDWYLDVANRLPAMVLDYREADLFKAWQATGYYMQSREAVEALVQYANDLGDYANALENENAKLMRASLNLGDIPSRPVFVNPIEQDAKQKGRRSNDV